MKDDGAMCSKYYTWIRLLNGKNHAQLYSKGSAIELLEDYIALMLGGDVQNV